MPTAASQVRSARTAALKTRNFGQKPNRGGTPARLNMNIAIAAVGIATSVISAYSFLKIIKTMYFDEPAPAFGPTRDLPQTVLIALAAIFVSPLGYLCIPVLGQLSLNAASALF